MAFNIVQIPRDDESIRLYVERYKKFRLHALEVSPRTFGSTLERELAFTDEIWYGRLANPQAVTFLALQGERIVGTLTTLGPLPFNVEDSSPSTNPWNSQGGKMPEGLTVSHWRINGTFVLPEFRGHGIAKALMGKVIEYGTKEAARTGLSYVGSLVVDADNTAAKSLYERSGFEVVGEETRDVGGVRSVLLMKCSPKEASEKDCS